MVLALDWLPGSITYLRYSGLFARIPAPAGALPNPLEVERLRPGGCESRKNGFAYGRRSHKK